LRKKREEKTSPAILGLSCADCSRSKIACRGRKGKETKCGRRKRRSDCRPRRTEKYAAPGGGRGKLSDNALKGGEILIGKNKKKARRGDLQAWEFPIWRRKKKHRNGKPHAETFYLIPESGLDEKEFTPGDKKRRKT